VERLRLPGPSRSRLSAVLAPRLAAVESYQDQVWFRRLLPLSSRATTSGFYTLSTRTPGRNHIFDPSDPSSLHIKGLIIALDRSTGRIRWTRDLQNEVTATPTVWNP
jgi:hypothetical protein